MSFILRLSPPNERTNERSRRRHSGSGSSGGQCCPLQTKNPTLPKVYEALLIIDSRTPTFTCVSSFVSTYVPNTGSPGERSLFRLAPNQRQLEGKQASGLGRAADDGRRKRGSKWASNWSVRRTTYTYVYRRGRKPHATNSQHFMIDGDFDARPSAFKHSKSLRRSRINRPSKRRKIESAVCCPRISRA